MILFCLTYIACCSYFTKCRCDIDLRGVLVQSFSLVDTVSGPSKHFKVMSLILLKNVYGSCMLSDDKAINNLGSFVRN